MADLTEPLDGIVSEMGGKGWADDWAVAWTHEGDEVICVKPARDPGAELKDVEDLVLFMAEYGMHLGYAPGGGAADPQYQFKRME